MTVGHLPREIQDDLRRVERPIDLPANRNVDALRVRGAMGHRRSVQAADERMTISHRKQCQATPGPRHGDIVEAAIGVAVLAVRQRSVPAAVENDHIVELEALRPVCRQE